MTDFISIKEATEAKKGSFIATVINISDLKSGTNKNGDWTMKIITVEDVTGRIDIAAFKDEIQLFELNNTYEITPWYKCHEGKLSLAIGKFGIVVKIVAPKQESLPAVEQPVDVDGETLPKGSNALTELVETETITLLQIEREVKATMAHFTPKLLDVSGQKIGMFVKEIYRESKKIRFEKGSD